MLIMISMYVQLCNIYVGLLLKISLKFILIIALIIRNSNMYYTTFEIIIEYNYCRGNINQCRRNMVVVFIMIWSD